MQSIRNRRAQTEERIRVIEEEGGSIIDKQNELDRLKQLVKNLRIEEENRKKELVTLQKIQKEHSKKETKLKTDIDKLNASISAKTKKTLIWKRGLTEQNPLMS